MPLESKFWCPFTSFSLCTHHQGLKSRTMKLRGHLGLEHGYTIAFGSGDHGAGLGHSWSYPSFQAHSSQNRLSHWHFPVFGALLLP